MISFVVRRGPHKGKAISGRYFANERFANPFYEYVHHASGFTDYATIVADQASLEALLTNAETMSEILTLGTKVTIVTEVKSKDSRHGNNHGGFVGGVETISHERRGRIPVAFKRVMETEGSVKKDDFREALGVVFNLFPPPRAKRAGRRALLARGVSEECRAGEHDGPAGRLDLRRHFA